jgi:putative acyl-CoA dehydrogenase
LTCFLLPRFRSDGQVNAIYIQRLKDKLGNRSNASSEVEFVDAEALRVGPEGQGIRTIIQMVQLTRLDCAIASAGLMRASLAQALHHARHRSVFQKHLADQPLMQSVLADMALQVEASVALVMRLARSFDRARNDAKEAARMRILTPAVKYFVCKSAPAFAYEAMECLGGNGYVEESVMPRHYREAPVNAIWEGSGNVMCLDVLRAVAREREPAAQLLDQLVGEVAGLPGAAAAAKSIADVLASSDGEGRARRAVERLALLAATAALNATAPDLGEAFARSRLAQPSAFLGAAEIPTRLAERLMNRALPR